MAADGGKQFYARCYYWADGKERRHAHKKRNCICILRRVHVAILSSVLRVIKLSSARTSPKQKIKHVNEQHSHNRRPAKAARRPVRVKRDRHRPPPNPAVRLRVDHRGFDFVNSRFERRKLRYCIGGKGGGSAYLDRDVAG